MVGLSILAFFLSFWKLISVSKDYPNVHIPCNREDENLWLDNNFLSEIWLMYYLAKLRMFKFWNPFHYLSSLILT